ncbi:MAG: exodeoxyribonuclease VII small subunit [Clostridia bacterium]|nr:exodeoxyribonuclease VII small subunit [Clostridia bacterium]
MTKKEFSFENALEELQKIVNALEAGNVGLDQSLGLYERGVELVRLCNKRLDEAQQRVDAVRTAEDGSVTVEPFEGEGSV